MDLSERRNAMEKKETIELSEETLDQVNGGRDNSQGSCAGMISEAQTREVEGDAR